MATDDLIRASDIDRESVVATLREAYTAGRLTMDEFDERTTAAYAGKTWGDLRELTVDLPIQPVLGSDIPGWPSPEPPEPASLPEAVPFEPVGSLPGPSDPPWARPAPPVRRRRPVAILIPVVVWSLLVLHSGGTQGLAELVIVMVVFSVILSLVRRR